MALKSFTPGKIGHDYTQAGNIQFANKYWTVGAQYENVGSNYNAEVGYVPRHGYFKFNPFIGYLFLPKGGNVLSHGPQINLTDYYGGSLNPTDNRSYFSYQVTFRDRSVLTGLVEHDFVKLLSPFDPTNFKGNTLPTERSIIGTMRSYRISRSRKSCLRMILLLTSVVITIMAKK